MEKAYRITVIGAGDRGGTYMRMLDQYYKGQVVMACVCDILPDRQAAAFKNFGFETENADWKATITSSNPDIVVIATPAYFHCDIAEFAMKQGCHVLTEKPFDLDMKKCFALQELSQRTGKKVAIGLQYRNVPVYRAMKHAFNANILGTNRMTFYNDMRMTRPKIAMHDAKYGNGGPMVDMACHLFDLMRWYYECDPVSVFCQWSKSAECRKTLDSIENKAADTGVMTLTFEDGSLGVITMNWGFPNKMEAKFMTYLSGSEGLMDMRPVHEEKTVTIKLEDDETMTFGTVEEDTADMEHPEKAVFDHFIKDIESKGKIQASFREGIVSLACSMAAMKSGALGRPVTLAEIYEEKPTIWSAMQAKED